jgi:hypothetical protein
MSRILLVCALAVACAPFKPLPAARGQEPAITSVDGEILGVDRVTPRDKLESGVLVTLRTSEEAVVVDLAPGWYLGKNGVSLDPSERIRAEGRASGSVLYATSVEQRGKTVRLRDAQGRPLWKAE